MGLLNMIQGDPEKQEALRQGLLSAGIQMLAGGRQDFGTSLGQGMGAGVGQYSAQMDAMKKKKAKDQMLSGLFPQAQPATMPGANNEAGAPAAPETSNPYAQPQQPDRMAQARMMASSGIPEYETLGLKMALEKPDEQTGTSEMKNWQFAQSLPEDQRAQFLQKSGGNAPSTVQEWEYFNKLDPQSQGRFLEMKRNPQIMNLGGSQAVRAPGGGISENYAVTPKMTETPEYQAAQETAKVSARESVQRGAEATGHLPKVQASAENARNMVNGILNHPGFSSTVGVTAMPGARFVPGTKEADFMSRMDQLKGSAFLQAFETLKGGGQITEVEGKKATDAINRMSISTSENEFKSAAQDFLSVVNRAEQNAQRAAGAPTETATPEQEQIIRRLRAAGVPDAQIAQELNGKRKQASGTFKDPISVTNDADYNSVPKGKYYKAPDGSIRVRK